MRLKRIIAHLTLPIVLAVSSLTFAEGLRTSDPSRFSQLEYDLFNPFFAALSDGDVTVLKNLLSDAQYNQHKTLLNENAEYSTFLRSHYEGATFELLEITDNGQELQGQAKVYWPDGRVSEFSIFLQAR